MDKRRDNPTTTTSRRRRRVALLAAGLGWVALVALGMGRLVRYDATPGVAAAASPVEAESSDGATLVAPGRASVVMFLHPFCPCSRASVDALASLVAGRPGVSVTAVFSDVRDDERAADDGALWRQVGQVAGVRRIVDRDAALARQFDARTSGQTFVYDGGGTAGYRGGLTAGRSHPGESLGLTSARAVLDGVAPTTRSADVFGCELN